MNHKLKLIIILLIINSVSAIDNPHFYRAALFYGEPRLKKDLLLTIDVLAGGGKTSKGLNGCGQKTNVLNIYGSDNLKYIGKGAQKEVLEKLNNPYIADIWQIDNITNFGKINFCGKFQGRIYDIVIDQNFCKGFFAELFIPFSSLRLYDISFDDMSSRFNAGPQIDYNAWRTFTLGLDKELARTGLRLNRCFNHTGIGDINLLAGWTYNNDETCYIDFIDATIKFGALFPTGRTIDINNVFDLPQGYDGHWGLPLYFDASFGVYDWLTAGVHAGVIPFLSRTDIIRMKTAEEQNGFILLSKGKAKIDRGPLWNMGAFLKADHASDGFSLILSYRYDQQTKIKLTPCDLETFDKYIVNTDSMLRSWEMHTIQIIAEYDFATLQCPDLPRVNIFFDIPVAGRNIFKTKIAGGGISFDYVW